jgi:coxsackievirus/adenovirus receptor
LNRAKGKAEHLDHQSEQMSDISRNARKHAEELEKIADDHKKNAKGMKDLTLNASDLAKKSIDLQRTITDQLSTKLVPDFPKEKKKLESLQKLTKDSLDKANSVFDESLTLFANINAIQVPELNLAPLKDSGNELVMKSNDLNAELEEALNTNNDLLNHLEDNIQLSDVLIKR